MTTVNIYLNFDGACEEAFRFYQSVFGGEYDYFSRFKDMPQNGDMPPLSEADENKILHVSLPISKETSLMGSDVIGDWSPKIVQGNNFSVSVNADTLENAYRLFAALSEGGTVTMPLEKAFWGAYFGSFTDKFGINWMINFEETPAV